MAEKLTAAQCIAEAGKLLAPLRDKKLSDTDQALMFLYDAVTADAPPTPAPQTPAA